MATSAAGLSAAYATEINDCSFNADMGPRIRSRDQQFCANVTVAGATTLTGAMVSQGPASFALPITVKGSPFSPVPFLGVMVLASGPLALPAPTPPTPPESIFTDITVNGTASIANGIMDAGAY